MAKGKGRKASLKSTLVSQQSRLRKNTEAKRAAQAAQLKTKKTTSKSVPPTRRLTIPFTTTDKILLIGEGNFSFTRALIMDPPELLKFLPAGNITATSYDSEEDCYTKYPDAHGIVTLLREKGVEVMFDIDGTALHKTSSLKNRKWDRVMWNFPHAGKGITDQDRNIVSNQVLILGFLRSVSSILTTGPVPALTQKRKSKSTDEDEDADMDSDDEEAWSRLNSGSRGTVLVTLRNVAPYTLWDLPKLAKQPPPPTTGSSPQNPVYLQLRSFAFNRSDWKGYEHRMTKGERANGTGRTGEGGEDRTWEFCLRDGLEQ